MTSTEPLDLDEIAARAAGLYEYATGLEAAWQAEADQLAGTDVPALLAEVRRLRDELAALKPKPCVECDHPHAVHLDGDDPVTPGICTACDPDDAHHYYRRVGAAGC